MEFWKDFRAAEECGRKNKREIRRKRGIVLGKSEEKDMEG